MKCRSCGADVKFGLIESVCPSCGARTPSARDLMILAILWSVFVIFGLAAYLSSDEHGFAQYIGIALGVVLVVGHLAWAFVLLRRRTRASHG